MTHFPSISLHFLPFCTLRTLQSAFSLPLSDPYRDQSPPPTVVHVYTICDESRRGGELEDAQKLCRSVIDCFEKASIPGLTEEERRTNLHFVVIGGSPTGVEFAAELHDFLQEDLFNIYPMVKDLVKITVIQSGDYILNMFDERISTFAEQKFQRNCIEIQTGCRVVSVSDKEITMKVKSKGEANRRVLATNKWLQVKGCENVYAFSDCATIDQRKIMDIASVSKAADKDNSGTLTVQEFQDVVDDILIRYPPTGTLFFIFQVAAQQGTRLSRCFNRGEHCKDNPEGPRRFVGFGRQAFAPFQYAICL